MSENERYHSASPERRDSYKSPARSPSRSRSPSVRSRSRSRSYSPQPKKRTRSRSRSRSRSYTPPRRRSRRRSYSRSYSRSRSRSRSRGRRHRRYSRSRSRSRSPRYRRRRGRSRSDSRSPLSNRKRHQGNRFNPNESRVLGIFGLSLYTSEKDLRDLFSKYGPIEDVQVVYDHQTGRSRGFSFIYFEDIEDAVDAKEHCNGLELDGRRIRVDYSITKRAHTPTPGVYMGKPTRPAYDDRSYGGSSRYDRDDRDRRDSGGRGYYY